MKTWLWKLRDPGHKEGSLHVSKLQRQITRKEREFQCHWISLATMEAGGHRKLGDTGSRGTQEGSPVLGPGPGHCA